MIYFVKDTVYTTTGNIVALLYIESFTPRVSSEESVISTLKDDLIIDIRTISGAEYEVSTKTLMEKYNYTLPKNETKENYVEAILRQWMRLLRPEHIR